MPDVKIFVLESFFDRDAAGWVEGQHLVKEIERFRIGGTEERLKGNFLHVWKIADVFLSARRADSGERFFVGSAKVVEDLVELVNVVATFEEGLAAEEFCKDTAD